MSHASTASTDNRQVFFLGMRDGLPIGLGYFAVAFSLGVAAKSAGLTALEGFIASLLCNASAGEYVAFTLIAADASYFEIALATFVANARYLLMGCALCQRCSPDLPLIHRLIVGFDLTDELFGIAIARPGPLNPWYSYGAMCTSIPFWATGTALGVIAGNMLSVPIVSALSVALFGMFLAIIIPPAKTNRIIGLVVAASFASSWAASVLPVVSDLSSGNRTILLTVILASAAALLFPRPVEEPAQ